FMEYCNHNKPVAFTQKVIYDDGLFDALHRLSISIKEVDRQPLFENELKDTLGQLAAKHGSGRDNLDGYKIQSLFDDLLAEENFAKFSLPVAARRFGIDKYKFIRLFKFQTGLTPSNYFILKRIEKSKTMLADGHDLLSVAVDLGFYDAAHYSHHFKKFTGISPIAWSAGR
ncbi:MAG: helix-turn-helix domain-containing protein, partial [Mucilaginibacter sp.]